MRKVLAGTVSHGLRGNSCAPNSEAVFISMVAGKNRDSIIANSAAWLGVNRAVFPGSCPIERCCYSMTC
eukprot:SAG11_NODE_1363_length_5110_cov_7.005588_4_plen_69_part_00